LDPALLFFSAAEMLFLISNPMAAPIGGGTALPIYNKSHIHEEMLSTNQLKKLLKLKFMVT
jgi:hypothetical protein